jgi:NADH dehydrogenase/NADH:ubiquinone oxidoreductase subunit G
VILVGPAIFSQPDRRALLQAIYYLHQITGAQVIVIPEQASLVSLLLGIPGRDNQPASTSRRALYLLGENIDKLPPSEKPFILYQNIYPPLGGPQPDLILPMAAFSEENGSVIDYAGQVKTLRRAVPAPGQALPAWEILCRIAQKMGLAGFDFSSVEDIRAEMASQLENSLANGQVNWAAITRPAPMEVTRQATSELQPASDTYLGFPLTHYIQGLNQLTSKEGRQSHG